MTEHVGGDDMRIKVDTLATELEKLISDNVSMAPQHSPCIFRVPNILSRHKPEAYAPYAFSFGPFHYAKSHLQATQKIKLRYLHELTSRFPDPKGKLMELTAVIIEVQNEARECYEGSIDMNMDEFVKVLVLDGCFLIELFCKCMYINLNKKDDPIVGANCMTTILFHDLILLENQIPWLVLECLFEMSITPQINVSLITLVTNFFHNLVSREVELFCHEILSHEHKHILDLLRNSLVLPSAIAKQKRDSNMECNNWLLIPSTTSLQEAGIKLKAATTSPVSSILDIKFKDGVLEIPQIIVQDLTEPLFRNLICLEQCLPCYGEVISSYMALLDYLINTPKDMEVFIKNEIIENFVDIEDATIFFNQIFNDVNVEHFYYFDLVKEVNKYYRRSWPRYRRVLIHDYFKHPWAVVSVLAASILLILTFLQTLFAIIK
ncbi:UPF0481 protein At3g47200-like [Humulus lupulus]|uniref:UPF0481 protein At3g47200-like n=1 Tax=Humulus lupulus TaxID=3486 RepID=UPI002B403504|nr:UPF0481 protein At3g47200-like [Humulus lupulus]